MLSCLKYDLFGSFNKHYHILALVPVYNEEEMISDYIRNVSRFVDGMIIIDDGSTDNTYEKCVSEKVLLRVKKKRIEFNDLENRNFLLKLSKYFNYRWFLFIDADERFEEGKEEIFQKEISAETADAIAFPLYHIWNDKDMYRVDYPHSKNGAQFKVRLFMRRKNMEIKGGKLHSQLFPYTPVRIKRSTIKIKHLGHSTPEKRLNKYYRYTQLDPNKEFQPIGYDLVLQ